MNATFKTTLSLVIGAAALSLGLNSTAADLSRGVKAGNYAAGDAYKGQAWEPTMARSTTTLKSQNSATFKSIGQGEPAIGAVVKQVRAFDFAKHDDVNITIDGPVGVAAVAKDAIALR